MSESYFCCNCWALTPRDDLSYVCLGCGETSLPEWMHGTSKPRPRPVRDLRAPWYARWLSGDKTLACPSHPGSRLLLFCPVCNQSLSEASVVRRGKPMALGIAGPRSAGKTLFIIALVRELRRRQVSGRPLGLLGLDSTEERFSALESAVLQGRKLDATAPEEAGGALAPSARNFCWQIQSSGPDRRGAAATFLTVYDVAGETWGSPSDRILDRFERYVAALTSLIFLVDGAAVARDLGHPVEDAWDPAPGKDVEDWVDRQWLSRAQERLGRRSRQVDLALVLSKADCLWDRPGWEALRPGPGREAADEREKALERLLHETGRNALWTEAHQSFRNVKLFAVSSLGFRPGPEDVEATNGGGPRLKRELSPAGVTDPAVWLLGRRLPVLREESEP